MKYILGVDAGNTKSIALVAKLNGKIIGWGRGGCGDIYNAGSPEKALQNVDDAVQAALLAARCRAEDIVAASFSMAGADWPEDFSLIENSLRQRPYCRKNFVVVNDAIGALRAGAVDNWGVAIANGTGAAISARSKDGKLWQHGWWQEGGGSRSLGNTALRAVYRSELGITGKTALAERIVAFYGLANVDQMLHQFTRRENPVTGNAPALGRLVLDVAHEGDAIARQIVRAEGTSLGDYVLAAARKVGIADQPFPLILTGSVFKHQSPLLTRAILDRVHSQSKGVKVSKSELEPSAGALIMSLEAAGVRIDARMRANLKFTSPPASFFAT